MPFGPLSRPLHRRLIAWLAACALLLAGLLPAVSQAVVAQTAGPGDWIEVCTSTGMAWVRSGEPSTPEVAEKSLHPGMALATDEGEGLVTTAMLSGTCDWCQHAPGAMAVPTPSIPLSLLPPEPIAWPRAFLHAPRTPFAWAAPHSRAPPATA